MQKAFNLISRGLNKCKRGVEHTAYCTTVIYGYKKRLSKNSIGNYLRPEDYISTHRTAKLLTWNSTAPVGGSGVLGISGVMLPLICVISIATFLTYNYP